MKDSIDSPYITVLPAKSGSYVTFCLQSYLYITCVLSYPQDRTNTEDRINIQVIYRLALAQVKCTLRFTQKRQSCTVTNEEFTKQNESTELFAFIITVHP